MASATLKLLVQIYISLSENCQISTFAEFGIAVLASFFGLESRI
jgi:hypothetical protein